ncbi:MULTISPECIES: GNAT family N-acetyltransferase [unclassified Pseudomonas]|uniref:GNAT family N-acetyltransferase n=1 Tax=unclassified Pseudomonas TaxID=196821 RepID=UPI00244C91ED|nr:MULTISPECIES: GNAT family N-acetyltransferase [unclassified Pseudomonas]MDH0300981.1 GNAT family N-acetyltransferase [Pseudomonas sp. GD04091]MDH1983487.1 GNAT family N-acetyltransferase [Pseudomonas sp. GD03689]
MPRLDWLKHHMAHCDTLAQWLHQQFHYEYVDVPLRAWQREFAEGQHNGQWQCLVALDGDRLLGSAALTADDLPGRSDIGPWLACVFVAPQARGQGLAQRLVEGICDHARSNGITKLYLHTHDRSAYYAKRGWTPMEPFEAWGREHWLMSRVL